MVSTRSQYQPESIQAAKRVLLELTQVFEVGLQHIVFVGGTACALLFPQDIDPHEGTIDIDMALDTAALADYEDDSLEDKLMYANYQQVETASFRWDRRFRMGDFPASVMVEFLSGEYDATEQHLGARPIQGISASVLRGVDLAFLDPHWVHIKGELPNGTRHEANIRVCSPGSLLAMKGISIVERKKSKDKDAIDIDYILRRYEGGPAALARVLQTEPYSYDGLVQEGLQGISNMFNSIDALGPMSVANLHVNSQERDIARQGAFLRVQRLLRALNFAAE